MRFLQDKHGGDPQAEIDFSVNISPLGMSGTVFDACVSALRRADRYPDPYCAALRAALSVKESVPAENILAGNGAAELIYAYAASHAGERAAVLAPTFSEYANAVRAFGGEVGYVFDFAAAERAVCGGAKTVFVCAPNNPDGAMPSRGEVFSLADACAASGARLFLDACFYDFVDDPEFSLTELFALPSVLVLQALTKSCALAGVRLGYLMGASEELQRISEKSQPWNVSSLAQAAGAAAAVDRRYFGLLRETVRTERAFLEDALRRAGYAPFPSRANFLLFEGEENLAARLKERGIAIRDCGDFAGLTPAAGKRYYRIGVRTHAENEALRRALLKEKE